MPAEAVYLFFHRLLKAFHDEKGDDRCGKAERYAYDGDLVDRRRKSLLITPADSFGYEIR